MKPLIPCATLVSLAGVLGGPTLGYWTACVLVGGVIGWNLSVNKEEYAESR